MYQVTSILFTVLIYELIKGLYHRRPNVFLSPFIITPIILICLLSIMHISYGSYNSGAEWLTKMLQPATVAFALPLYKNFPFLRKHKLTILLSIFLGSLMAIASTLTLAVSLKLSPQVVDSIVPRSITTPIAMIVSQSLGGIPTMTAAFVMLSALTGIILGPLVLRWLPIRTEVAKGLLLGVAAHGAGTSKAFELSPLAGAVASLSMIITAGMTLVLAPLLLPIFQTYIK